MTAVNTKEFCKLMKQEGTFIVDVREAEQYADAHIKNAFNIPSDEVVECSEDLPKDEKILVVCGDGETSKTIAEELKGKGFDASYLEGGIEKGWKAFKLPTAHSCAT
ncbi:rhodanese-like domain-containing protein [Dethiosulfovibrio sp. F2B]|uniref:rhodanese-like domain-containing protein n=1 Tax=Dethiosulfovibrio faecalis TaxID=2720018 RepID=UPI001F36D1C3|nr:rhodanese-like domain-containing protein [Dethiosulfovibrio faecalis]MCF4150805.1 rhodanese-like domain-containing protein [Dethiosulfovibrio faecalis]